MAEIVLEGGLDGPHSFARVNRALTTALRQLGLEVRTGVPDENVGGATDVTVRHCWPPRFAPSSGPLVQILPWEWGALPSAWLPGLRHADEIWAPSRYVEAVYRNSGVEAATAVVPDGVDTELFRPGLAPLALPGERCFRFLFVGGTIFRKGIDILIEAYLREFSGNEDVCLVVKDHGTASVYRGQNMKSAIERLAAESSGPRIVYLDATLDDEELARLYDTCDVLVHPYRGEGFGLPMLEAMACGRPVIVPRGGACLDFCSERTALFVEARRRLLSSDELGLETAGQAWVLEPDVAHLRQQLRRAFIERETMQRLGAAARRQVLDGWTWRHAARKAQQRLERLAHRTARNH